jgi:hypothetical protein
MKFTLPEDIDPQTALNMLAVFKKSVNELVILHNVITPEGRVLVKGGAIHNLLVEIINCEKQLKTDMGLGLEERG